MDTIFRDKILDSVSAIMVQEKETQLGSGWVREQLWVLSRRRKPPAFWE
jgi:hypothetical protein